MNRKSKLLKTKVIAIAMLFVVLFQVSYPLINQTVAYAAEVTKTSITNEFMNDGDNISISTSINTKEIYSDASLTYVLPEGVEYGSLYTSGNVSQEGNEVTVTNFDSNVIINLGVVGKVQDKLEVIYEGTDTNEGKVRETSNVNLNKPTTDTEGLLETKVEARRTSKSTRSGMDYGDAPASYGSAGVGAGGRMRPSAAILNASVSDAETAPQYSADAKGDDKTGRDDENGINGSGPSDLYFSVDDSESIFEMTLNFDTSGVAGIWMDQDGDGTFSSDEGIVFPVISGKYNMVYPFAAANINRQGATGTGDTYMRFRYFEGASIGDISKGDAAKDFPAYTGETEDYIVHLKSGKAYSGYNHLVINATCSKSSSGDFLYEGIKYGGSSTGYVDLKVTPANKTQGTITQQCSGYTGWNTNSSYTGDLEFRTYVSTDSNFNEDTPIAMNLTFTVSDMDLRDEFFSFDKSYFKENENFGVQFSDNSSVTMTEDSSKYKVQATTGGENYTEEYSTAWSTIQTSDDPTNPAVVHQGADLSTGRVIQANISIGGPLISVFTGYPTMNVAPNVYLDETVNYVAELGGIKYNSAPTQVDRIEVYFDDPLLDENTITNVKLKDQYGNAFCDGGTTVGSQSISCNSSLVTMDVDKDAGKIIIGLDSSLPTTEILQYDVTYDIDVEDRLDDRSPDGNKINDPYLQVYDDSTISGEKISANELQVQKPSDLTDKLTAEYTVSDGQTAETEAVCAAIRKTKSIEVDGCAEHGETLINEIVISNTSGYAQHLTLDFTNLLDEQNKVDGNDLNNANLTITDQNGDPVTSAINPTNKMEVDISQLLGKDDIFTIKFDTKVDLSSSDVSDKYILNQSKVGTTDATDLNHDGTISILETIDSNNFYVAWYDDTVNGFEATMTADDLDLIGPNSSGFDPSDIDTVAEPNEYIEYKVEVINSGMLDQTNLSLDLSTISDLNLDTTQMLYCIDSSDVNTDCDSAKTSVTGNTINVGTIAGGATTATATTIYIDIPTIQALDYSQVQDVIKTQTISLSSDTITNQEVSNTEKIPLIDISAIAGLEVSKVVTDGGILSNNKADPDETLHYEITVSNNGYSNIPSFTVLDDLNDTDLVKGTAGDISNIKVDGTSATNEINDDSSFKVIVNETLDPASSIVVSFDIKALDIFDATNEIDSRASVETSSISAEETTVDIEKNMEIDPTDPIDPDKPIDPTNPQNVIFTKTVTDGSGDGIADVGEMLHYEYNIENTMPVRANVALQDVTLVDDLTSDSDVVSTVTNLTIDGNPAATTDDILTGVSLGDMLAGDNKVVEFDTTASATFDASDVINTTAMLHATNFTADMPEDDSNGGTNLTPDIAKNMSVIPPDPIDPDKPIDPTNPQNVIFTKTVTELVGDGDNLADPNETLHYEYGIENTMPVRANVALQDVILKDDLSTEVDLKLSSLTNMTVNGVSQPSADIVTGINLGDVLVGNTATVSFDIDTKPTFVAMNGINTEAQVTSSNMTMTVLESWDGTQYVDVAPDLAQDLIIDPIDPDGTHNVEFVKEVTDPIPGGDNNNKANVSETLHYKYTVINNADRVLKKAKLKDPVSNEPDLDTTDLSNVPVTITIPNGGVAGGETVINVQNIVDGVVLGNIKPGKSIILEFDLTTNPTFVDGTAINSAGVISSPVLATNVKEKWDGTQYVDNPDIEKDTSIIPSSDISFVKTVTNTNSQPEAIPGDVLHYEYVITNTSSKIFTGLEIKDDLTLESDLDTTDLTLPITITSDYVDYIGPTTSTIGDFNTGINLQKLGAGNNITLTFDIPTTTVFTGVDNINSKAQVTLANTSDVIFETFNGTTYEDVNPDFIQNTTIDPTNPIDPTLPILPPINPQNVTLVKEVTDLGDNNGQAIPGEELHYKYTITNTQPIRSNVVIEDVILTDPLNNEDSDVDSTISGLTIDGNRESGDITTGLDLGNIAPGQVMIVEFDTTASATFDSSAEINTTSTLTATNFSAPLEEDDSAATVADIEKDMTIDPTDPIDPTLPVLPPLNPQNVTLVKEVTDSLGNNNNLASPAESLHYTYTITNNSSKAVQSAILTEPLDDNDLEGVVSNLTVNGNTETGDITAGLSLGDILSGDVVVVEFDTTATSTFSSTAPINTTATLTANNFSTPLDEDDSAAAIADIAKDTTIDPTDPIDPTLPILPPTNPQNVTLVKTVTDPAGNNDNLAQAGEQLHYVYTITNTQPIRSNVIIENAILIDNLVSDGLDNGSVANLSVDGTPTSGNITTGLSLGDIAVGQEIVVEFDVNTTTGFTTIDPINTTATLTADNFSTPLDEDDSAAATADIAKDQTGANLSDIMSHTVCYVGTTPTLGNCTTSEDPVSPEDYIGYKLVIDNTGSSYEHTVTLGREQNATSPAGGDIANDYEIARPMAYTTNHSTTVTIPAGGYFEMEYADLTVSAFTDSEPITNKIEVTDSVSSAVESTLEVNKVDTTSYGKLELYSGLIMDIKAQSLYNQIKSASNPKAELINLANVHGKDVAGNDLTITSGNTTISNPIPGASATLTQWQGVSDFGGLSNLPEGSATYQFKFTHTDSTGIYEGVSTVYVMSTGNRSNKQVEMLKALFNDVVYEIQVDKDNTYYLYGVDGMILLTRDEEILKDKENKDKTVITYEKDKNTDEYKLVGKKKSKITEESVNKFMDKVTDKIKDIENDIKNTK